jgi:hypothetical protein
VRSNTNSHNLIDVQITGFETLIAFIDTIPRAITKANAEGLQRWGRRVMLTSRQRYVPVLSGDLARSGRVNGPFIGPEGDVRLELNYTQDYALDQESNENYRHPRGGQAHFLEQAVDDHKHELLAEVKAELGQIGK